ncbi:MAG: AMMECR1 domain-containing protein, partial [Candidatus Methanomethylophilus sp.]|nr:AMMECR1 domain-containing protein [Methanomethylophilus sp.]
MSLLTDDEGAAVVRAARAMVEAEAAGRDIVPPEGLPASMDEKSGVFVTLEKEGRLRGCIGIVMPVYPARQALMYAARD